MCYYLVSRSKPKTKNDTTDLLPLTFGIVLIPNPHSKES